VIAHTLCTRRGAATNGAVGNCLGAEGTRPTRQKVSAAAANAKGVVANGAVGKNRGAGYTVSSRKNEGGVDAGRALLSIAGAARGLQYRTRKTASGSESKVAVNASRAHGRTGAVLTVREKVHAGHAYAIKGRVIGRGAARAKIGIRTGETVRNGNATSSAGYTHQIECALAGHTVAEVGADGTAG
jgi:hypothetical protein